MDAGDYSYNVPSFVPPVVDADAVPNRFRFRAMYESMMRNDIMMMAGDMKGFFPLPFEAAATAAETNDYSAVDAVRAFNQISGGDSGVLEFQSIVGKLPIDDLESVRTFLELPDHMMQMFEHGFSVDADLVRRHLRAPVEPMVIKKILKMASKVKVFLPSTLVETATTEAAATAAETNYGVEDAVRALRRMSGGGDSSVVEFQSIVGKLPIDDLQTLEKLLEEPYHVMLRSEMGLDYNPYPYPYPYLYPTTWRPEVKAAASGGGGDSFMTKFAGQAIGAMLTKVVGGAVLGAFDPTTTVEPFELEKAAGAMGLMSVIGGMVVQDKKPGLSGAMVKFGSVAIALAMIVPMAGNLENVIMAWIFGVLAAAIVAVTVTFA